MAMMPFAVNATGTPAGKAWDTVVATLYACDSVADLFGETQPESGKEYEFYALSAATRRIMWNTPAPDLTSLAWKLAQAIAFEGLEGEADHPLNCVLRDLLKMGAH